MASYGMATFEGMAKMEWLKEWMAREVLGNELWRVLALLGGVLGGLVAGKLVRHYLEKAGALLDAQGRKVRGALFHALGKAALPAIGVWGLAVGVNTLVLGDRLLSLGRDGRLLVWRIGQYDAPEVAIQLPRWGRHGLLVLQKGCVHAVAALDSVSVLPDTGAAGCDC